MVKGFKRKSHRFKIIVMWNGKIDFHQVKRFLVFSTQKNYSISVSSFPCMLLDSIVGQKEEANGKYCHSKKKKQRGCEYVYIYIRLI